MKHRTRTIGHLKEIDIKEYSTWMEFYFLIKMITDSTVMIWNDYVSIPSKKAELLNYITNKKSFEEDSIKYDYLMCYPLYVDAKLFGITQYKFSSDIFLNYNKVKYYISITNLIKLYEKHVITEKQYYNIKISLL